MVHAGFVFEDWLKALRGKLIVSCQALPGEALFGAEIMGRMALAAQMGGAVGIRANSPQDIRAIRAAVDLPIIGLFKDHMAGYEVFITPTLDHAKQIAQAGADVISIDATQRPRPEDLPLAEFIRQIKAETGCPVLADISTLEEAGLAAEAGADLVASTLSGYTPYSPQIPGPDLQLVADMAGRIAKPCLAEGRYASPEQVVEAVRLGAYAVIVGGAITRPAEITARFVRALEASKMPSAPVSDRSEP
jgi:N-acylglucosamine-6-phosphate 2-epimerase